jgi:hypothetical protein
MTDRSRIGSWLVLPMLLTLLNQGVEVSLTPLSQHVAVCHWHGQVTTYCNSITDIAETDLAVMLTLLSQTNQNKVVFFGAILLTARSPD